MGILIFFINSLLLVMHGMIYSILAALRFVKDVRNKIILDSLLYTQYIKLELYNEF